MDLRTQVSLLPTPTVQDASNTAGPSQLDRNSLPLNTIVTLLPTPKATNNENQQTPRDGAVGYGLNLGMALTLLPTPAVNDMGAGKTVEHWDEWTAAMQAKHGNGNGHGKSLAIETLRLLPTPTAMDSRRSGGSSPSDVTLTDAVVRTSLGANTNPRFDDGDTSSDAPLLPLPSQDPKADND